MKQLLSGVTTEYEFFDMPPGLSAFNVYSTKDGESSQTWTTPTVFEISPANQPRQYRLLLDEHTTVTAGKWTEVLRITVESGVHLAHFSVLLVNPVVMFEQQLTESYAADGVAPTLTQAVFLIQQMLTDFNISGTTWTTRQIDGATTAASFTLDNGTNPTDITRSS